MRKGFTMIELIFVIVILGILAAVAIPRLAATRDDAEISKAATNVATAVTDITSYYTAQGTIADNTKLSAITNVPLDDKGNLLVKKVECVKFVYNKAGTPKGATSTDTVPVLEVTAVDGGKNNAACRGVQAAVKKITESSPIRLGGSGVNFEDADQKGSSAAGNSASSGKSK